MTYLQHLVFWSHLILIYSFTEYLVSTPHILGILQTLDFKYAQKKHIEIYVTTY